MNETIEQVSGNQHFIQHSLIQLRNHFFFLAKILKEVSFLALDGGFFFLFALDLSVILGLDLTLVLLGWTAAMALAKLAVFFITTGLASLLGE